MIPDIIFSGWPIMCGIVAGAIILDIITGDPPTRYHPTSWAGTMIARLIPYRQERYWGVVVVVASCGIVVCVAASVIGVTSYMAELVMSTLYVIPYVAVSILILKSTIAIRGMEKHAKLVHKCVVSNDARASAALACIVKRNTDKLSASQICSGAIESVAENTVDGTTAPLFYMGFFGIAGALIHRTINTIDSMAGYHSDMFKKVGWFGATCDTILGWAPARITGYMMVLSAYITGFDHKEAYNTIQRDHKKPDSLNSGYTMSAMAGALNITLEKPGKYTIGTGRQPGAEDIKDSIRIMKCTSYLFGAVSCGTVYVMSQVWQWAF